MLWRPKRASEVSRRDLKAKESTAMRMLLKFNIPVAMGNQAYRMAQ